MTRPSRVVRRFLRVLAGLYPRDFRARFGGELLETYRDAFRAAAARGGTAWRARFVVGAIGDALTSAGGEYFESSFPRRSAPMEATWMDLVFACRSLRRRPAFVATVVLTLALGIGANTAVFSLIDAVVLRPIAVDRPEGLVSITRASGPSGLGGNAYGAYRDLAAEASTFSGLAAYMASSLVVGDADVAEELSVALVSDNYFSVLGVRPAIGRTMSPGDPTAAGANPVAVISSALWRRRFASDPGIVGKRLPVGGQSLTIIGVTPESFRGADLANTPDMWVPTSMARSLPIALLSMPGMMESRTGAPLFRIFGRLSPGVTREQAAANITAIDARWRRDEPPGRSASAANAMAPRISVVPITEGAVLRDRDSLVRFVRLLFGVVALTLLLACVNVANLMVVRAAERARELGVRSALGAGAGRLMRQLLIESLVLAMAGGIVGLGAGEVTLRLLSTFTLPGGIALSQLQLGLDLRVLAFTSLLSVATAIAFGLIPAWRASRPDVTDVLKHQDGRAPTLAGRGALLAIQVSISLVLLIAAGLFLRSLQMGLSIDLGFDPRSLAAVSVRVPINGHGAESVQRYAEIVERAAALPGMISVAAATHVPLSGARVLPFADGAATTTPVPNRKAMSMSLASVTPPYFGTLGVPILSGRGFTTQDGPTSPRVVVINESAARAFWPNEPPLGKQINFVDAVTYTVIGVVRDTKYATLQDVGVPFAFAPMSQEEPLGLVTFVARSADPKSALAGLQRMLRSGFPEQPIRNPRLVTDQIDKVLMPQRFGATLLSVFSLIALAVSAVGIYGTVAYTVARRTTEIGIRMALGARGLDVIELVLARTGAAVVAGLVVGVVGALLATKLLVHYLFGITAVDGLAFGGAIVVMVVVSIGVAFIPARRATRVDPVDAIRST